MSKNSELLQRADKIKKLIDSGKLKGAKLKSAKYAYYNLRYRAKNAQSKQVRKTNVSSKASKHKAAEGQAFLPGFLTQMNMVRIEELIADRVFKSLQKNISEITLEELVEKMNDLNKAAPEMTTKKVYKKKKSA